MIHIGTRFATVKFILSLFLTFSLEMSTLCGFSISSLQFLSGRNGHRCNTKPVKNVNRKTPKTYQKDETVIQKFLAFLDLSKLLGNICFFKLMIYRKQSLCAPQITEQPVPGSQLVQWERIKTSKAKIRRARLGKGGGGSGKNGRESLLAFL